MKKIIFIWLLLLQSIVIHADYDYEINGLTYEYSSSLGYPYASLHYGCKDSAVILGRILTYYTVREIDSYAFHNCHSLEYVRMANSIVRIWNEAFSGCDLLSDITLSPNLQYIGVSAFYGDTSLTSFIMPNSVNSIGSHVFCKCRKLQHIKLSDNLTSLPNNLFRECAQLDSLVIPDSVTTIDSAALRKCYSLKKITLGTGLTSIGNIALSNDYSLERITIPNNVTTLGNLLFANDTSLKYVSIGSGLSVIGNHIFSNCHNLDTVVCWAATPPICNDTNTYSELSNVVLLVPVNSISNYITANYWRNFSLNIRPIERLVQVQANDTVRGLVVGTTYCQLGDTVTINAIPKHGYFFSHWNDSVTTATRSVVVNSDTTFTAYFSPYTFCITASVNIPNYGSAIGSGIYDYNTIATLIANPSPHYHLVSWSNGATTDTITILVQGDSTLTASFAIDRHTITCSGANGSVTGGGIYDYGTTVNLTAVPDNHYYFARWSDGDTVNPRSIIVGSDTTYTAVFEGVMQTITVGGANGTVTGGGSYHYGSTVRLSASANPHYHFVRWTDGNTASQRDIVVNGDNTYTAIFEIDKHTVSASGSNGTVTGTGEYDYGSTFVLTATADEHYHFARWADGDTRNPRIDTVYANITLTAVFEIDRHTISVVGANGTVTGDGIYDYGESISLTATPDEHYHFVGWSDGDTLNPRPIVVTGDSTFTAVFEIDKHTVWARGDYGTVTGTGEYDYGSNVVLTAVPDEHYQFVRWGDGDTSSSRTVTVLSDTIFDVVFDSMVYTIATIATNGTTTGDGEYKYTYLVTLTATADEGYRFTGWSDGSEYNPYIFEAVEDVTLEAYFEKTVGVENVTESVEFYYSNGWLYNPEGLRLYLYSTEGKLVKSGEVDIDMTGFPEGVYFVRDEKGRTIKIWK